MSLFSFLTDTFKPRPRLRNKAGGMAWIRRYGETYGADVISGHVVRTEWFDGEFWRISPQPQYQVTKDVLSHDGKQLARGTLVAVVGLPDHLLMPLPGAGVTRDEVQQLYQPGPATTTRTPA